MFFKSSVGHEAPAVAYEATNFSMDSFTIIEAVRLNKKFRSAKVISNLISIRNNPASFMYTGDLFEPFSTEIEENTLFGLNTINVSFASEVFLNDYIKTQLNATKIVGNE